MVGAQRSVCSVSVAALVVASDRSPDRLPAEPGPVHGEMPYLARVERWLCPLLLGRDGERALLESQLDLAGGGEGIGGTVAFVGEPGIGKSRLAREAAGLARTRGGVVLMGRATGAAAPSPYEALADAVLGATTHEGFAMPEAGSVFRPAIEILVGGSGGPSAEQLPAVLVADSVLRVVAQVVQRGPGAVILEDLHWADPETLAVVDYLADRIRSVPAVLVVTARPERGGALALLRNLHARRAATVCDLARLSAGQIEEMACACLQVDDLPSDVVDVLVSRADGVPFVLEEVLAASVASGALRLDGETWQASGPLPPVVPFTLAESVERRLAALGPPAAAVLRAAAVAGDPFDWRLLPAMTNQSSEEVLASLGAAADVQLITAEERSGFVGSFRFRHALTRDAVLAELLPPARAQLAAPALDAIESLHPGLPGATCEAAARFAEEAGFSSRAVALWCECARRALDHGALTSAAAVLEHARTLAIERDDQTTVDQMMVKILTTAGKADDADAVGTALLEDLAGSDGLRRAAILVDLASAAVAAGRWDRASELTGDARCALQGRVDENTMTRAEVIDAHIAIGRGDRSGAVAKATGALESARRHAHKATLSEALLVSGQLARGDDLTLAETYFSEAEALAGAAGLVPLRLRCLHELGTIDLFEGRGPTRLLRARRLAASSGAVATLALIDLHIAVIHLSLLEPEDALAAASRSEALSRSYSLSTLTRSLAYQGIAHGLACRRGPMEAALKQAVRRGADLGVEAIAWGDGRSMCSLLSEDRGRAIDEIERAVELGRAAGESGPPYWGMWALLRSIDGDGSAARGEVSTGHVLWLARAWGGYAEAVGAWRDGDHPRGEACAAAADAVTGGPRSWARHMAHRLMGEAALAEGWGHPNSWLSDAAAFFDHSGHARVASACRTLLRRSGNPLPQGERAGQRSRGAPGITARESEVLDLLCEGLANKEIAARLYLSPRTVEKHVERLLLKTGSTSRAQLALGAIRQDSPSDLS